MRTYDEVLSGAQELSPADKARLLEAVSAALRQELAQPKPKTDKQSMYGLWAGDSVSAARREMWGKFPREDI